MASIFENFPYSNFHDMNLDWMIEIIRELETRVNFVVEHSTIKYADPIGWNITSQYEANTIVVDNQTGNAYISSRAVPAGVHITRTEYWSIIFNYSQDIRKLEGQIAAANEGSSTTATAARSVGSLVWLSDKLYRITAAMIAGDSYVVGSNCAAVTIETILNELKNSITTVSTGLTSETAAREAADNTLSAAVTAEATTRASADTALSNAILAETLAREAADTTLAGKVLPAGGTAGQVLAKASGTDFDAAWISMYGSDSVNVRDFGAVGNAAYYDNVNRQWWTDSSKTTAPTSDVAAFEAALAYAAAHNIHTIVVPDGAYYLPNKTFTIDAGVLRFVGENNSQLISTGLAAGSAFITLVTLSPFSLIQYDYAKVPLSNISIKGNYFANRSVAAANAVAAVCWGTRANPDTTMISPHMALYNVVVHGFNAGGWYGTGYKSSLYNCSFIACDYGIRVNTDVIAPAVPLDLYGCFFECCDFAIYNGATGYNTIRCYGGAFEYNRHNIASASKTICVGVRFEGDLKAACDDSGTPNYCFTFSDSLSVEAIFIDCQFLFLSNYVDNVQYWIPEDIRIIASGVADYAMFAYAPSSILSPLITIIGCNIAVDATQMPSSKAFISNAYGTLSIGNTMTNTIIVDGHTSSQMIRFSDATHAWIELSNSISAIIFVPGATGTLTIKGKSSADSSLETLITTLNVTAGTLAKATIAKGYGYLEITGAISGLNAYAL